MALIEDKGRPRKINRNKLYRERPVKIELQQTVASYESRLGATGYVTLSDFTVELTQVTSIKTQVQGGVGQSRGVIAPILQMWYLGPISVSIMGRSFMGAYADLTGQGLNLVGVDDDAARLIRLRDKINATFATTGSVGDFRIRLTWGRANSIESSTSLKDSTEQTFVGYIDQVSIEETEGSPYIFDYTIQFIGVSESQDNVLRGHLMAKSDKTVVGSVGQKGAAIAPAATPKTTEAAKVIYVYMVNGAPGPGVGGADPYLHHNPNGYPKIQNQFENNINYKVFTANQLQDAKDYIRDKKFGVTRTIE